jgi:hypothetical protein
VDFLALPEEIITLLPPPAERYTQGEQFPGRTGLLFDVLGAVEASVSLTVQTVLHPARMERLVAYGSMGDYPDLGEVVDAVIASSWGARRPSDSYRAQVLEVVQRVVSDELMALASDSGSSGAVRAVLSGRLDSLRQRLERDRNAGAHAKHVAAEIVRWQQRAEDSVPTGILQMPPGDPI